MLGLFFSFCLCVCMYVCGAYAHVCTWLCVLMYMLSMQRPEEDFRWPILDCLIAEDRASNRTWSSARKLHWSYCLDLPWYWGCSQDQRLKMSHIHGHHLKESWLRTPNLLWTVWPKISPLAWAKVRRNSLYRCYLVHSTMCLPLKGVSPGATETTASSSLEN